MDTIINAPPIKTIIPAGYVLHYCDQVHSACGTVSNGSNFYSLTHIRSAGSAPASSASSPDAYLPPIQRPDRAYPRWHEDQPFCAGVSPASMSPTSQQRPTKRNLIIWPDPRFATSPAPPLPPPRRLRGNLRPSRESRI